jgi:hypothetical protein
MSSLARSTRTVRQVTAAGERPAELPGNCSCAGTKPPQDRPCRQSSGSTSDIFGNFLAQGGRIAEENRCAHRWPHRCTERWRAGGGGGPGGE